MSPHRQVAMLVSLHLLFSILQDIFYGPYWIRDIQRCLQRSLQHLSDMNRSNEDNQSEV